MEALRYNHGKPRYSLLDYTLFENAVRVLEYGEHKYSIFQRDSGELVKGSEISIEESKQLTLISSGRDNWRKGFPINELKDSAYRHMHAYNNGEIYDAESGCHHLGHLVANIMFLFNQEKINK